MPTPSYKDYLPYISRDLFLDLFLLYFVTLMLRKLNNTTHAAVIEQTEEIKKKTDKYIRFEVRRIRDQDLAFDVKIGSST